MKRLLQYIPGFRSGMVWKKIVAIFYFGFSLLMLAVGFGAFLFFLSVPFLVFSFLELILRNKKGFFVKRASIMFVLSLALAITGLSIPLAIHEPQEPEQPAITEAEKPEPEDPAPAVVQPTPAQQVVKDPPKAVVEAVESLIKVEKATVARVIDGDTIEVRLYDGTEERVRMIGVDTPESTREVEPFGKESAAFTQEKLDGKIVYLEIDTTERDRFGRLLAYIWLFQPANDKESEVRAKMFNAQLLLSGHAQIMTIPPNIKYVDYFTKFQTEAREGSKGLWAITAYAPVRVNINTASLEELIKIIHIEEERAKEIIELRPFASLDDLDKVSGIGPARLRDIKAEGIAYVQ